MVINTSETAAPAIPSELIGPVPRKITFSESTSFLPFVLVILIVLTVISDFFYCRHAVIQMRQTSALQKGGVEVQAAITFLKRVGRGPNLVQYTFLANGQSISGQAEVPPELMAGLRQSNTLPIRYLPSNPAMNHPAAWYWSLSSEWLLIFMLLGLSAVCGVTCWAVYRDRKLLAWGKPVAGIVKNRTPARRSYLIKYEFRADSGEIVSGSGTSAICHEIGAPIWILYLTQNSRRNRPYPLAGYCVEV